MTKRRACLFAIGATAVITAVMLAVRQAWVCDDALISFRYVRNVVAGNGLVFNVGERIEGFSNGVFLLLLAPFQALHADLFTVANALGIIATAVEVVILVWLLDRRGVPLVGIAIVAGMFATDRITSVWATGGLEVAVHGMLVTALLALQLERPQQVARLALLHALVAASRPEGGMFFAVWVAHLVLTRRTADLRRALNVFVPVIVVLLLARVLYYGELTANPYRAKVAGVPTFELGAGYALWFLRRIGLYGWTVLAVVPLAVLAVHARVAGAAFRTPLVLAAAFVVLQLIAVVAMGGDYMTDFRFLRPILGAFYLALGCGIAIAWQRPPRALVLVAAAVLIASHVYRQVAPVPIFDDAPPPADHKRILTIDPERPVQFAAAVMEFAQPGDAIVVDWAGYMAYGHDLRTVDCTGLISRHLERDFYLRAEWGENGARERLPGHARWPTIEMMQREHFTMIFPKVNDRPPEDPEVTEAMPRRTRDYPFLHVTVPLPGGHYLRFFTTLTAEEIATRARARHVRACVRAAFSELTCVDGTR